MIEETHQESQIEIPQKSPFNIIQEKENVIQIEKHAKSETSKKRVRSKKSIQTPKTDIKNEQIILIQEENQEKTALNTETIITPLPEEVIFLKNNLKTYKEELKILLSEGLETYKINFNTEILERKKNEINEAIEENQLKNLLEITITPIIDSKPANKLTELINQCQDLVNSITDKFISWDAQKYFDFILSIAERKNYLERIKICLSLEEIKDINLSQEFYIFEIKNIDALTFYADVLEVVNTRKLRVLRKSTIEALNRLIINIEKLNSSDKDELEKVYKGLELYKKKKEEKIKFIEKKINPQIQPTTTDKKRKQPSSNIKESLDPKDIVNKNLKRLKIDSDKDSFISNKENISEDEGKIEAKEEEIEKKEEEEEKEIKNKKNSNQKSILSFFTKKTEKKSEVKPSTISPSTIIKEEKKSIFRCVGSIQSQNMSNLEKIIEEPLIFTTVDEELLKLKLLTKQMKLNAKKSNYDFLNRKIYLHFADSLRQYKGVVFDKKSQKVKGRTPLEKDDLINYEYDSDEEIEEQNAIALDIPSDEKEIDDEDDDSEEDEQFVVPDGYLSDEEKVDEDGEIELNRPEIGVDGNFNLQTKKPFMFNFNKYNAGKDTNLDDFIENFKVFIVCNEERPITVRKHKKEENNTKGDEYLANGDILKEFIRTIHGSYENKPNIINDFNAKYSNCSKASIERKIKEICKKDKLEGETKARYLISKEIFESLKMENEYDPILKDKFELNQKKEIDQKKVEEEENKTNEPKINIISASKNKDNNNNIKKVKREKSTNGKTKKKSPTPKKSEISSKKTGKNIFTATSSNSHQKDITKFLNSGKKSLLSHLESESKDKNENEQTKI